MENDEDSVLLQSASYEIRDMRRRMEVLQAKVDTMEIFDRAIRAQLPSSSMGYAEDLIWKIEKRLIEKASASNSAHPSD